jgi:hypothetical protein
MIAETPRRPIVTTTTSSRADRRRHARKYRPRVERVEDRTLLSAVSWIGGNGDWDTGSNWSTGQVPGANDDVTINVPSIAVTHSVGNNDLVHTVTSSDPISFSSGSLTIGGASTINAAFSLSGGTLYGPGALNLNGLFSWTGGQFYGNQTVNANAGVAVSGTSGVTLNGTRFNNAGTFTWTGTGNIQFSNGVTFNNLAGATFNAQTSQTINANGSPTSTFNNAGTFTLSGTSGTTNVYAAFKNTGIVNANTGTLALNGGGLGTGTYNVPANAILEFGGQTTTLGSTSKILGAGGVTFSNLNGQDVTIESGTFSPTGPVTITNNAQFTLNSNASLTTLNLNGGASYLQGSGTVTVTSALNWQGGVMAGNGTTSVPSGSTLAISGTTSETLYRPLSLGGTGTWAGAGNEIYGGFGAVFTILSTGSFTAQNDQHFYWYQGADPVINNAGTFAKSGSGNETDINVTFNNTGTVNAATGTLSLNNGGVDSKANTVAANATLQFGGGTMRLTTPSTITGAGAVTVTHVANTTTIVNEYGTDTATGPLTVTNGGQYYYDGAAVMNVGTLNFNGNSSYLGGTGPVNVTSAMNWQGGTMNGTGSTTIATGSPAAVLTISGTTSEVLYRTLNLNGTGTWSGTGNDIYMGFGSLFSIGAAGSFTAQNDQHIYWYQGVIPTLKNAGTFTKNGSGNETDVNVLFTNTGTVNVATGTLSFNGGGSDGKTNTVAAGATLQFGGGVMILTAAATETGAGNFVVTSVTNGPGIVNNSGLYTMTGAMTIQNGGQEYFYRADSVPTLNLLGNSSILGGSLGVTVTSALNWQGGTMNGIGVTTLTATGVLNISGTGSEYLDTRTLTLAGTTNWTGTNNIYVYNGALITNTATGKFNIQNDQSISQQSGVTGTFANAGTVTKSVATNQTAISLLFTNTGTVNAQTGTLSLNNGGSSTKAMNVSAGAALQFGGGVMNMTATSTLANAGTVFVNYVNATVPQVFEAGTYSGVGTVTVENSGQLYFNKVASVATLNLINSGSYLGGSATLTVTSALNWQGGEMFDTGATTLAAAATLAISGTTTEYLDTRTLNIAGTATWAGVNNLYTYNGAVINIQATGSFTAQNDQGMLDGGGAVSTINNAGTLAKNGGTLETDFNVIVNNTGTVNAATGTLSLNFGGTNSKINTVQSGAALQFGGGITNLTSTSTVSGAGAVTFTYINGSASTSQTYEAGSFTAAGPLTITSNGQFYYNNNATGLSVATLNLNGGSTSILGGTGAVTVTANLNWQGGQMFGTGSTTVASGATLAISGTNSEYIDTYTLNNAGTATWAGANNIYGYDGAVINNMAGATFTATNDQVLVWQSGITPVFNNAGTFTKSAGSGITYLEFVWNGAGALNVQTGTVDLYEGGDISGAMTVSSGATLNFANGTSYVLEAGSSLGGAGNVGISVNTLDDYGSSTLTGGVTVSSGTVNFAASQSFGSLTMTSGAILIDPAATVTLTSGDYTQSNGSTYLDGGTIAVGATHKVNLVAGNFYGTGTINGALANATNLYVGGYQHADTLTVNGTYTQTAGTIYFDVGGAAAGQYDKLVVTGAAKFAGNASVTGISGYVPPINTVLTLITYASHTGTFASVSVSINGHGGTPTYGATSFTVKTT